MEVRTALRRSEAHREAERAAVEAAAAEAAAQAEARLQLACQKCDAEHSLLHTRPCEDVIL